MSTHALTFLTHQRRTLFQVTANADLLLQLLFQHREQNRYHLHAFAVMPDHVHILLTPGTEETLSRNIQAIKGGFSFAVRERYKGEVWHAGHHEHRIRDIDDFINQARYIAANPVRRSLPDDYRYVHTYWPSKIDPIPSSIK